MLRRSACRRRRTPGRPLRSARPRRARARTSRAPSASASCARVRAPIERHDAGPFASTQAIASCDGGAPLLAPRPPQRLDERAGCARSSRRRNAAGGRGDLAGPAGLSSRGAARATARRTPSRRCPAQRAREDRRLGSAADRASTRSGDRRWDAPRGRGGSCRPPPRRARSRARTPPSPGRRWRRSCPRSGRSDRAGPGDRCRCGRRRAACRL